ncbi:putative ABC-type xenobiotic transporter [Helianthus anomalus]
MPCQKFIPVFMIDTGSHSQLLQDLEGAYAQLIRLQHANNDSISHGSEDQEISMELTTTSSQKIPHLPLSSGSHHSMEEETVSKKPPEVPLRRLAYLNKPELPILIMGAIAAITNGAVLPTFGILISNMIKTFYEPPHKMKSNSKFWAIMFILLGVVACISLPARTYFFSVAGCRLIKRMRSLCFEKVINMEIGWFDKPENSSGAIGARLSADAASVRGLVGDALAQLVQDLSSVVSGLTIAFATCWQLAFIILALIPLVVADGFVQLKSTKGFSADAKMMYEEASQVASDAIGSIRTVASFCAEEKVMRAYRDKCAGPERMGIKQGLIAGGGFGVSCFLLFCVYAASFYAGAWLVEAGTTTFPKVFRVFYALTTAAMAVSNSGKFAPDTSKAKSSVASVFAILDRESEIDPSDESGMILQHVKGEIELRHVSFRYPARPNVEIFRDLCLTINSGKTVALVGESGSGKSTIISLLQRFYNPGSGCITMDGYELHKFQLKWLRLQMGLVSQEPVLFNDTIRANIAYGEDGDATEAEILAASELANAHGFISGLHQGYNTMVGERGVQLSGGQKQRVAIARAIVKSPKILLLDEATSALDAESEKVVQDALDRVMVNRTTVVVAHRLSTIKGADLIVVVKNGVVVEKGKHEELINITDGSYTSLVTAIHSTSENFKNL